MRLHLLAVLGLAFFMSISAAAAETKIAINSSTDDDDVISHKIINAFQADVAASAQYSMVSSESSANYIVEYTSIVDDTNNDNSEQTTAYSVVLLDHSGYYVSSLVGVCGDEKASSCAEHLFESIDRDIQKDLSPSK